MTGSSNVPFSPIALVGTIALLAGFALGAWCVAAGIAGNARKSRRLVSSAVYGLYGFTALIGLASALMIYGFVTHDFSIKYVASTSDVTMSTWYKVTSFWGGLDGSLLFWVLVLALFSTVAIVANHKRHRDMIGYVVATIMVVQVFFLSLLVFTKNPFATFLTTPPTDGQGLNPLLQNYWMVIHPPSLYTGFVAATIPFAFCIGALASGRLDDLWLGSVRVWMLICFGYLSLGLILGGRWAYEVLGWGGYWAWDPVENAGLMPWFTATAFLHSAIIQEQRGMMKTWNVSLVVMTFFFTIFGTFMTRSGAVQSVHAFGEDNILALNFIVFMAMFLVVSIGLIIYRSNQLATKTQFDSFYSREFAFLVNNWILLACAFFVLFATMFPTISEALDGSRVSVGPDFFNKWMTPLGLVLVLLSGVAPLLAWRKTTRQRLWNQFMFPTIATAVAVVALPILLPRTRTTSPILFDELRLPVSLVNFGILVFLAASIAQEFWRGAAVRRRQSGSDPFTSLIGLVLSKRRKYGGYIIHLGVGIMFLGFAGKAYERTTDRTIDEAAMPAADGTGKSSFEFGDYSFSYERLIRTSDDHKDAVTAQIGVFHDRERIATLYPARWDYHKNDGQLTTEPAIKVRAPWMDHFALGGGDVYVVLTGWGGDPAHPEQANFRVFLNPLVLWVWLGFLVLAFGTLVCLIPQFVVDAAQGRLAPLGRTKLGRAADVGILVAIVAGLLVGLASQAQAAGSPGGAAEHPPAGMGMGQSGAGWAAKNRPTSDTASQAMRELLCPCGCARQSILTCDCQTASDLRGHVMALMTRTDAGGKPLYDLSTDAGRHGAYDQVLASFVSEYGEQVLATPRSKFSWLVPTLAAVGGIGLLFGIGRRWVARGSGDAPSVPGASGAAAGKAASKPEDDVYADKLDDELADSD